MNKNTQSTHKLITQTHSQYTHIDTYPQSKNTQKAHKYKVHTNYTQNQIIYHAHTYAYSTHTRHIQCTHTHRVYTQTQTHTVPTYRKQKIHIQSM